MNAKEAFWAPTTPPDTGASTKLCPYSLATLYISKASTGPMVELSIKSEGFLL